MKAGDVFVDFWVCHHCAFAGASAFYREASFSPVP